jgi:uncharacterized membrane protein
LGWKKFMRIPRPVFYSALGLVSAAFLLSGATKVTDPVSFAASMMSSPWLMSAFPQNWLVALAFYLPWLELALGLALWVPPTRRAAICLLTGLVLAFSIYLLGLAWMGHEVPCGCFGDLLPLDSAGWGLARNGVLLLCLGILIRVEFRLAPEESRH